MNKDAAQDIAPKLFQQGLNETIDAVEKVLILGLCRTVSFAYMTGVSENFILAELEKFRETLPDYIQKVTDETLRSTDNFKNKTH